ncbi:MAG: flagellar export chaperone FliS [Peptococcaceae bacterium]|nr:flagellar export chaperone FliS [Peptococcaceae bacterium]
MNTMPDSSIKANPQKAYQQVSIQTAPPEKLLIMLYSAAIKNLQQGKKAIEDKQFDLASKSLCKVQDILVELNNSLDMEKGGEIASNLRDLYEFYEGEVIKANLKKDPAYLQPVLEFLQSYRDVWIEAAKIVRMGAK